MQQQHIHILGIGGTFMAGIAVIAKEMGYVVSGSDKNLYPPMSSQLEKLGIRLIEGYDEKTLLEKPDLWLVGNGLSRGNCLLEALLDSNQRYLSAPQWLYENVLRHRHVIAIAGTHGKTTTTAMATFMLDFVAKGADVNIKGECGYLVGGVAYDFEFSARLGNNKFFVIEADEYDTALFDKRSKFVHYHPNTLILNNLEFDHADIFADLAAIETQFHHLVRMLPRSARVIANYACESLHRVQKMGYYCDWQWFNQTSSWHVAKNHICDGNAENEINLIPNNIIGAHNRNNSLAAALALLHIAIPLKLSIASLSKYKGVHRRLECRGVINVNNGQITIIDDFAHHPTAMRATLAALSENINEQKESPSCNKKARIIAVVEPRSNTMKMGVFAKTLADSLSSADVVLGYGKNLGWDLAEALSPINALVFNDVNVLVEHVVNIAVAGDTIIGMSNGSFDRFHELLIFALEQKRLPLGSA